MGRRRLIKRDDQILLRYCQGFNTLEISEKFHISRSQLAKIIRRAESEGYEFKIENPQPWPVEMDP